MKTNQEANGRACTGERARIRRALEPVIAELRMWEAMTAGRRVSAVDGAGLRTLIDQLDEATRDG